MNSTADIETHPVTTHLREAAEHIRRANHASYGDRREVTDLYDTLGALHSLLARLPQLLHHLRARIDSADAASYDDDRDGGPVEVTLGAASIGLTDASDALKDAGTAIAETWSDIGHLQLRDPDATEDKPE